MITEEILIQSVDDAFLEFISNKKKYFTLNGYSCYLVKGRDLNGFEKYLGLERSRSYNIYTKRKNIVIDLDSRDIYYDHIFIWHEKLKKFVGGVRVQFYDGINFQNIHSNNSYLVHCYPDILERIVQTGPVIELGRTFISSEYQKKTLPAMYLMKTAYLVAIEKNCKIIIGMATYDQYKNTDIANEIFYLALSNHCFFDNTFNIKPRYNIERNVQLPDQIKEQISKLSSIRNVQQFIELYINHPFILPILIKQYIQFNGAKVAGFSIAKDFNHLIEVLMYLDISSMDNKLLAKIIKI